MDPHIVKLIGLCLERNIPFVAYRIPRADDIMVWVQRSGKMLFVEDAAEVAGLSGFIYAPFHRQTNYPVVFFEPEYVSAANKIGNEIIREIKNTGQLYPSQKYDLPFQVDLSDYLKQAQKIVRSFGTSLSKTVLSRVILEGKPDNFNAGSFFLRLIDAYPSAFCHLINVPGAGCWAGATPEVLYRDNGHTAFTVALAGTRKYDGNLEVTWSDKEIEEQEMVSRFIELVLEESGLKDFRKEPPQTVRAGKVLHLSTQFEFYTDHDAFNKAAFLKRLHPTPAVCGLPRENALELIRDTEPHNREYYAGFCGPFNFNGNTDLFVNIRCMKIFSHHLAFYTGGGLTSGSIPESEWEETEWKAKTLLSLI